MFFFKTLAVELTSEGHCLDIATNESIKTVPELYCELGCKVYQMPWSRSPFSKGNFAAIKQLRKIVKEGGYDIVHCHTPICAACTRLACKPLRKNGLKVIYTAHGFHFFNGAPLKNWLIYYPIEWLCAFWTDVLITITKEDYELAKKHMHAKRVEYVPGVGIDVAKFRDAKVDRAAKRAEIGVPEDAFLIISVGELNENKNHEAVLREMAKIADSGQQTADRELPLLHDIPTSNIHYIIAGTGDKHDYLLKLAEEMDLANRFHLLGRRNDVPELLKVSDLFVLPSLREGLNVSMQEGKASGLECRCYPMRGNDDIITAERIELFEQEHINQEIKDIYASV